MWIRQRGRVCFLVRSYRQGRKVRQEVLKKLSLDDLERLSNVPPDAARDILLSRADALSKELVGVLSELWDHTLDRRALSLCQDAQALRKALRS